MSLVGKKFGRLTIIENRSSVRNRALMCLCVCDCGVTKEFSISNVLLGKSKSCGCLARERTSEVATTHGKSKTKEYAVWCRMWSRCTNPIVDRFPRYGGRGISVCGRWGKFENFWEDMGPLPGPGFSIGRIDNDGNYEPANCRWENSKQQSYNRCDTVYREINGEKQFVPDLAGTAEVSEETMRQRLRNMTLERAMHKGSLSRRLPITIDGVTRLTTEWMKEARIPISSFYHFQRRGLTPEQVVRRYLENPLVR